MKSPSASPLLTTPASSLRTMWAPPPFELCPRSRSLSYDEMRVRNSSSVLDSGRPSSLRIVIVFFPDLPNPRKCRPVNAACKVGRLEYGAQLGPGHKAKPSENAALDDRAFHIENEFEQLVGAIDRVRWAPRT